MSLDVWLKLDTPICRESSGIFIREDGTTREISREEWNERNPGHEPVVVEQANETYEVFAANITHNLGEMASEAGIYDHLWRPDEISITKAVDLVEPLTAGLERLKEKPEHYRKFNAPNGWGRYENLVEFVDEYLSACRANPDAHVQAWR